MKHAASLALYDYWNGLRGERSAPERGDVDPAAIRTVLANTFLIEVQRRNISRGVGLTVRLSGTRINALFGEDIKGRDFLDLWAVEDCRGVGRLVSAVLDDCSPAVAGLVSSPVGQPPLGLELLLLPLRHQGKTHARLLGSIVPASLPRWFGLMPTPPLRLTTQRMIVGPDPIEADRPLMGRRQPDFDSRAPRRHQHLLVYEGGGGEHVSDAVVA